MEPVKIIEPIERKGISDLIIDFWLKYPGWFSICNISFMTGVLLFVTPPDSFVIVTCYVIYMCSLDGKAMKKFGEKQ